MRVLLPHVSRTRRVRSNVWETASILREPRRRSCLRTDPRTLSSPCTRPRHRFALTSDDLEQCRAAFASYDQEVGWPRKLEDRERAYEGFAFEVEEPMPNLELTVRRFHGDAISATTRYQVDPEGVISHIKTRSTGPRNGLLPVLGGTAGAAAWLLWAIWCGFAALAAWWGRKDSIDGLQ